MDKWIGGIVAFAVVALIVWLMYRSWRRRTARDESLSSYPLPESIGAPAFVAEVLYVATTPVGDPLERLAVRGLAFRGVAHVEVVAGGLVLRVAGESTTFIPADPAPRVDSYLRARYAGDAARIIRAVNDIAAAPAAPRHEHESEASDG